jgi:hypothetical protein
MSALLDTLLSPQQLADCLASDRRASMTIDNLRLAPTFRERNEADAERQARDDEAALRRSVTADDVVDQLCQHHDALNPLLDAGDAKAIGELVLKVRAEYVERLVRELYA